VSTGYFQNQDGHAPQIVRKKHGNSLCRRTGGGERTLGCGAGHPRHSYSPLARFQLPGKFAMPDKPYDGRAFEEFDFATMVEWGFNFARLPLSYWVWGSRDDWSIIREEPLKEIDRAIELGRQYEIHINVNFHRIPGYCINLRELEPADLFSGTKAQRDRAMDAAVFHWKAFARRYKGIPNRRLSFDLINEPPRMRSYEGYLEE